MSPARTEGLQATLLWSVWTLAGIALASLLLTRELGIVTVLLVAAVYPLLLWFETRGRLVKARWLENGLILTLFAGSVAVFALTKASFLIVVADFLIGFVILKLLFHKERADLMQIIALSFFLLLSASTLALDFTYVLSFMLYVLAAAWTLSVYTLAASGEKELPADRQLLFRSLARNCGVTLALVLLFAAGIFVFFPRLSLAVFQGAFLGPARQSGIPDKMNLVKSGPIFENPAVVARVEMSPEDRGRVGTEGHLKGQTLSFFNGSEWLPSGESGQSQLRDSSRGRVLRVQKLTRNQFQVLDPDWSRLKAYGMRLDASSFVRQKIYLESIDSPLLFALPWVESLQARLPEVTVYPDGSVQRPAQFAGRILYEARSLVERPPDPALTAADSPADDPRDLQLPDLDFGRERSLLRKIVSPKDPAFIKARKIESYLSKNYRYSLGIRTRDAADPVGEFLFETKQGHCEYFASAMALLLRLEGVPARIATGFLMSEWNDNGGYFIVRSKDAHSWVEAKIGGLWVEFDPSPREGAPDLAAAGWLDKLRRKVDYANFLWDAYVLSYDMESQKQLSRNIELKSGRLSQSLERRTGEWRARLWRDGLFKLRLRLPRWRSAGGRETSGGGAAFPAAQVLGLLGLAAVLIWAGWKSRIWPRTFGRRPKLAGEAFYAEMLQILSKRGLRRKASETPQEFLDRVLRPDGPSALHSPELSQSMTRLTGLFYRSRFSGRAPDEEDRTEAEGAIREIRKLS